MFIYVVSLIILLYFVAKTVLVHAILETGNLFCFIAAGGVLPFSLLTLGGGKVLCFSILSIFIKAESLGEVLYQRKSLVI